MKIKFTFEIKGGPYDGARMSCEGESNHDDTLVKMGFLIIDGHQYEIAEFDSERQHAVITW